MCHAHFCESCSPKSLLEHNQISGVKMVPCVGESPALSPWLLSCTGGGNMQSVGASRQVRRGFIVTLPLAWRQGSPGSYFWDS